MNLNIPNLEIYQPKYELESQVTATYSVSSRHSDNTSNGSSVKVEVPDEPEAHGPLATRKPLGQSGSGTTGSLTEQRPIKLEEPDEPSEYPSFEQQVMSENYEPQGSGPSAHPTKPTQHRVKSEVPDEPNEYSAEPVFMSLSENINPFMMQSYPTTEQQYLYQYAPRIEVHPCNRELNFTTCHLNNFPSRYTNNNSAGRSMRVGAPGFRQPATPGHFEPSGSEVCPSELEKRSAMFTSYRPPRSKKRQQINFEAPEDTTGQSTEQEISENIDPRLTFNFGVAPVKFESEESSIKIRRIESEKPHENADSHPTTIKAAVLESFPMDKSSFEVEDPDTIKKEADEITVKTKDQKKKKKPSQKFFPLVEDYTDDLPKVRLQCHLCNTILMHQNSVSMHSCTHANLVFFECEHCDRKFKSFNDKKIIKKHMKNQHGIFIEKVDLDKFSENRNSLKDTIEVWRRKCFPLLY
ncbi:hypothetical protein CAEBREN_01104 [Caenorhabditis brenneri]|uniref:C2H2-type domain-containing protein n=1 Tax=Caenorhabditis brenneri TaxID=135651 RepID=G0PKD5_CAEBE|nr:hypothetical protein CAEBREN_01104 [Caenorhabditis brenneri]